MPIQFSEIIDVLGTLAFAISGAAMAAQKKLDILGVLVLAFVTAIGGGTLRDVLMGDLPVAWMRNETAIVVIVLGALATFFFERLPKHLSKPLFLFDSLGLGFFTVVGIEKALAHDFSAGMAVTLGTITACFGGVIRDVLLNQVPLIFRREIYASACIAGGVVYVLLTGFQLPEKPVQITCLGAVVLIRILAVRYNLALPSFLRKD
jgi:uncharacterized membrane protein YeiH